MSTFRVAMVQLPPPAPDPFPPPSSIAPTGSRVRIHGLQAKPEFNGRDGRVVSIDPESGRVVVEVEAHAGALLRLKPSNLSPSPSPPLEAVAEVTSTGHLPEREYLCLHETLMNGRLAVNEMNGGTVCKKVGSGAQGFADLAQLQDMKIMARLTSRMYSEWTASGKLPDGSLGGVYHFLRLNAENTVAHYKKNAPPGAPLPENVKQMYSAWCEESDVARWGDAASRRTGLFFLVEDTEDGAVLVDEKDGAVYEVFGIKETVCEPIVRGGGYLPQAVTTTLLPWRGRIVYDGVMKGNVGGHITPAVAAMLEERVRRARECGAVVKNISHYGPLSDAYDASKSIRAEVARAATDQNDAEVVRLAKKFIAFPVAPGVAGEMWIKRRFGYTKQNNPRNMLMCMAGPMAAPNGPAFTKDLDPTPEELLRYALQCAQGLGGRPKMLGVDHQIAQVRVAAALTKAGGGDGDLGKNNKIICGYYPPPSQEEMELSIRSGGVL